MALPAKRIPESVAHLDIEIVAAALIRNDANVRNTARDPSGDLRKLVLADERLADAALEAVELRLDDAEANLHEALHCDDPRRRDAVSMFFLRNTQRAAKRGYAVAASAASLEVSLGEREPQHITISWGDSSEDRETETFERDGQTFEVPRYGGERGAGDCLEGHLATAPELIDHQLDHSVDHRVEPVVVEPAAVEPAPGPAEPEDGTALRVERARVDLWISQRVISWPPHSCLRCRRPLVVGAEWVDVVGDGNRARLHRACRDEWQAEARRALGFG